jgi:hypothetical protein
MLNIEVNRSAEGVERYFDRELAVSDYLMKEPGLWAGRGAERLGLRGVVDRKQFVALLRNEDPTDGKRLTARMNTSREADGKEVSNRQVSYGPGLAPMGDGVHHRPGGGIIFQEK